MSLLKRIEKKLDQRLASLFSGSAPEPGAREALELYYDALAQISAQAASEPLTHLTHSHNTHTHLTIDLLAPTRQRKAVLEKLFEPRQLARDVHATLLEEGLVPPPDLAISIRFLSEPAPNSPGDMTLHFEQPTTRLARPRTGDQPDSQAAAELPATARLLTLVGISSAPDLAIGPGRINLGRERDVIDASGRPFRRNELFFPEDACEANSTVSRSHAHIAFDPENRAWRIYDDGSSLGTSLFRDGQRIEIPAHGTRGAALQPGDEICLGQARLKFVSTP